MDVIASIDPLYLKPFFDRHLPDVEVKWSLKGFFASTDASQAYLALDDETQFETSIILRDIYNIAENAEGGTTIVKQLLEDGVTLPKELREAMVYDLAMWVYLYKPESWEHILFFFQADTVAANQWHAFCVVDDGTGIPEDDAPDTSTLVDAIKQELSTKEGYARKVDAQFEKRNGTREYYKLKLSHFPVRLDVCTDKFSTLNVPITKPLTFLYHRDTHKLEIQFKGERRLRKRLGEIWADTVKGTTIEDDTTGKPAYDLERLKVRDFVFARDPEGRIVNAYPIAMEFTLEGQHTKKFGYDDTDGALHDGLDKYFDRHALPPSLCHVFSVKIRVFLNDSFGRCKRQTLKLTLHSSDVEEKNPKVKETLWMALKLWGIVHV